MKTSILALSDSIDIGLKIQKKIDHQNNGYKTTVNATGSKENLLAFHANLLDYVEKHGIKMVQFINEKKLNLTRG